MDAIHTRPYTKEDEAFIFATWLRSYRNSSQFARNIEHDTFYKWHHLIVERILERPTSRTLVAHPKDDPNIILGYLVTETQAPENYIHWVFVKRPFRRMGVARKLFQAAEVNMDTAHFTHWTFTVNDLIQKFPKLRYLPYAI